MVCCGLLVNKWQNCSGENTLNPSNGHTIVGHRNAGINGWLESVLELSAGYHTATALNDDGIIGYTARYLIQPTHNLVFQLLTTILIDPPGDFYSANIIATHLMAARFEQ